MKIILANSDVIWVDLIMLLDSSMTSLSRTISGKDTVRYKDTMRSPSWVNIMYNICDCVMMSTATAASIIG